MQGINFDDVVTVGMRECLYRPIFLIHFELGKFCNYSCSYCWPAEHSAIIDHKPTALVRDGLAEIRRQAGLNGFTEFVYNIAGGEPTLHPGYLDIVASLTDAGFHALELVSNLSHGPQWWKRFITASRHFNRIFVTGSWHDEGRQTRETFSQKLTSLQQEGVQACINIVMVPRKWDALIADATYFYEQGHYITIRQQDIGGRSADYTEDQLRVLRTGFPPKPRPPQDGLERPLEFELSQRDGSVTSVSLTRVPAIGCNRFQGWRCHAGFQMVVVGADGLVRRGLTCHERPLGTLTDGFTLFDQPTRCVTPTCRCPLDLRVPKHRVT
jgi:hypothetical protein